MITVNNVHCHFPKFRWRRRQDAIAPTMSEGKFDMSFHATLELVNSLFLGIFNGTNVKLQSVSDKCLLISV